MLHEEANVETEGSKMTLAPFKGTLSCIAHVRAFDLAFENINPRFHQFMCEIQDGVDKWKFCSECTLAST